MLAITIGGYTVKEQKGCPGIPLYNQKYRVRKATNALTREL